MTIFVSHASEDRAWAHDLVHHLEARGHRCWIAPRDVRAGAEYAEEIMRGITGSQCFVLLLSDAANHSPYVRREVERAVAKGLPVLPVRLEEVPPAPGLELFISTVQWIDAWHGAAAQEAQRVAEIVGGGPPSVLGGFAGHYETQGTNPDGSVYEGQTLIVFSETGAFDVTQVIADEEMIGTGQVDTHGRLEVHFPEKSIVATYTRTANGGLYCAWGSPGEAPSGTERLFPRPPG